MRAGIAPSVIMLVTLSATAACGSEGDVTAGTGTPGSATTTVGDVADVAAAPGPLLSDAATEGVEALDCTSGTATGMTTTEEAPAPGDQREPAEVVADALRANEVAPEAAGAVESLGPRLRERWAVPSDGPASAAPRASVPAGEAPLADVATGLGPDGSVDVVAAVEVGEPEAHADVVVTRDDRAVVTVTVSEHAPGYWALEQLWACSDEVTATEVQE
jgi:hypothetical protein